jgi:hypothetical protein
LTHSGHSLTNFAVMHNTTAAMISGTGLTERRRTGTNTAGRRALHVDAEVWAAVLAIEEARRGKLNRAAAFAQRDGPKQGLKELDAIGDCDRLATYPFYSAALGELKLRCGKHRAARSTRTRPCEEGVIQSTPLAINRPADAKPWVLLAAILASSSLNNIPSTRTMTAWMVIR